MSQNEHHFTAEGAPCQNCNVYLDDKRAAEPCGYDKSAPTWPEIALGLLMIAAIVVLILAQTGAPFNG